MSDPYIYPIAEIFTSIQGEGFHVGLPMTFIRFAGCNVGTPLEKNHPLFGRYTRCRPAAGSGSFICDTNYSRASTYCPEKLLEEVQLHPPKVVCLTGGEPCLHSLDPLVELLKENNYRVFLETSGTRPIHTSFLDWVTCSPKGYFLPENIGLPDEFKFLVGEGTTAEAIESWMRDSLQFEDDPYCDLPHSCPFIYLQPINDLHSIDQENVQRCLEIQRKHPNWLLSVQLHKVIGVR